ncbi:hypothetical protein FISHEDRAFT_43953 [Fistulina hepatica ATCC 64428]|uniref:Uncharacterized protein n=1 Tax=Fistulina hepatica ATCC 64428 TaxID=1128425 RepID=A0A0D7AB65_9AGAR|nr:hypothetical protein FISHEDRAFT_43953 [Fistulina hepatica ATCC 64428]
MNPGDWVSPINNSAYSRGPPHGSIKTTFNSLLVNENGERIPCIERHSTCIHMKTTRDDVTNRLASERDKRLWSESPARDIFLRTAAYLNALHKNGCGYLQDEVSYREPIEQALFDEHQTQLEVFRRGYIPRQKTCEGKLLYGHTPDGHPFVRCEHYSRYNRSHFIDYDIGNYYDLDYLEAVLGGDNEEAKQIEDSAAHHNYGPLAPCTTVVNFTSQRSNCPIEHRDTDGQLKRATLIHFQCKSTFQIFEPHEEYRHCCPFILLVTRHPHTHPPPIPQKTPPAIRDTIFQLLESLRYDLADLTPRHFLRHPIVKDFLRCKVPHIMHPSLSDLHISLANRDHLRSYINQAISIHFPQGTGWKGLIHMKQEQDTKIPSHAHYLRRLLEYNLAEIPSHIEDNNIPTDGIEADNTLRIAVCMMPEGSRRFLRAQYISCDISFKRIVSWYEFELAAMDRDANNVIVFCHVFLNRQTAFAHQMVFQTIHEIVQKDTGQAPPWRHLYATNLSDFQNVILQLVADMHLGQAKGFGLYLQWATQFLPPGQRDLHDPSRTLTSLSPYEHLHRMFRICIAHFFRTIKECRVPELVKSKMRGLACLTHPRWDVTLQEICQYGGKAGQDWVTHKTNSGFIFEGVCWEKSLIPKAVFQAGDRTSNIVKISHENAYREGKALTAVGVVYAGWHLDTLSLKTLNAWEQFSIRSKYKSGHRSENEEKNLKRKATSQQRSLHAADRKIQEHNIRLQGLHNSWTNTAGEVSNVQEQLGYELNQNKRQKLERQLEKLLKKNARTQKDFETQVEVGRSIEQRDRQGSGKCLLLLPK